MNLAIIGATGNVGRKTIEILEKSKIEIKKFKFNISQLVQWYFSSSRLFGTTPVPIDHTGS